MVSFILDPRISQFEEQRRLSLAQMLKGYTPSANPYGYTRVGHLEPLVHALAARLAGQRGAGIQEKQQEARSQVLSRLLRMRRGRPGESQYGTREVPSAGPPVDTFLPSTIMRSQPYRLSDDGQQIPGLDPLDPEVLKRAGTTPGLFALQQEESRIIGEERSEKKRLDHAKRMLATAETPDHKEFWLSEIDAVSSAKRGIESQIRKEDKEYQETLTATQRTQHLADRAEDRDWQLEDNRFSRLRAAELKLQELQTQEDIAIRNRNWKNVDALERRKLQIKDDLEKEKRREIKRWTTDGREVWISKGEWRKDQNLPLDQQRFAPTPPKKPEKPMRVGFAKPVNGRTSGWVMPEQLREDIKLPVNEQQFILPPGVSIGPDGRLVFTPAVQRPGTVEQQFDVAAETAFAIAEAAVLLRRVREFGGMTGLSGKVGGVVGGITGQVISEGAGDWVTERLTGVNQQKLQAFATEAAKLTAPFIPIITGEESGRYTQAEQDETKRATAILKAIKSPQQVIGAIGVILSSYATRLAKVQYVIGNRIDVTSQDGILKQMRRFKAWGLDDDAIEETIRKIQMAYGELNNLPADAYKRFTGRDK